MVSTPGRANDDINYSVIFYSNTSHPSSSCFNEPPSGRNLVRARKSKDSLACHSFSTYVPPVVLIRMLQEVSIYLLLLLGNRILVFPCRFFFPLLPLPLARRTPSVCYPLALLDILGQITCDYVSLSFRVTAACGLRLNKYHLWGLIQKVDILPAPACCYYCFHLFSTKKNHVAAATNQDEHT